MPTKNSVTLLKAVLLMLGVFFGLTTEARADGIAGTVTNASTSAPVQFVTVAVYTNTGAFQTSASTDAAGAYALPSLPTGSYYVRTFNNAGLIDEVHNNIPCVACSVTSGTPVAVTFGGATVAINFALDPGGLVSGTITNATTAAAVSGVTVQFYTPGGTFVAGATTNVSGVYTLTTGLPTGSYVARTFNSVGLVDELYNDIPCLNCSVTGGAPIGVVAGSTTTINFSLAVGAVISGTVTNATTSALVVGVQVQIYTAAGTFATQATTNGSGVYTTTAGLPTGSYLARTLNTSGLIDEVYNDVICINCSVTSGTPFGATAGATTTINFALAPGAILSGTITNTATSAVVASVLVNVYNSSGTFQTSATTNASGVYTTTTGLPSGSYFARTSNNQALIDELYNDIPCVPCNITTGAPIAMTAGSTTVINFGLAPGGTVGGTVTNASTSAGVSSVSVQVYNNLGQAVAIAGTNASGVYAITTGLPTGSYFVRTFNSQGLIDEVYNDIICLQCNVTIGSPVGVVAPSVTTINFSLAVGGRIGGTITNASTSALISGVTVQVYTSAGVFVTSVSTGAAGTYLTGTGLPTGSYVARTSNSVGYIDELYNDQVCLNCLVTAGAPIGVTNGTTTTINWGLVAGGRITGTITNTAGGAPLSGVTVQVYTSTGASLSAASTNAAGVYTIPMALPTGNYLARTFNSLGFIDEVYNDVVCLSCSVAATGTPIAITVGVTTSVNFGLAAGARITGTITNATTSAVLGSVTVQVYTSTGIGITSATTNASGVYTIGPGLPSGNYFARTFNSQGFIDEAFNDIACIACSIITTTPITLTAPASTNVNFGLVPGGRVGGTVTNAVTGNPVSGVSVTVYTSTGLSIASVSTNAAGVYASTGLPAGNYFARTFNSQGLVDEVYDNIVCVSCSVLTTGTPIAVTLGVTTTANFGLSPGGGISGTVTSLASGGPISGITVQFYNSAGTSVVASGTSTTGTFTSTALPPGTYYARTFNSLGFVDEVYNDVTCLGCNVTTGAPITVVAGAPTGGVNFVLATGGRISGTVMNAATGALLSGINVQVYTSTGVSIGGGSTNASGVYTLGTGLPTGNYFARTTNSGSLGMLDDLYNTLGCDPCAITTGTPIAVTAPSTHTGIDFALLVNMPFMSRADFDGDHKADILFRDTSGNVAIYLMNGTTIVSGINVGPVPTTFNVFGTGDYNGDGKSDILWRATTGEIAIWYMNGGSIIGSGNIGMIPTAWQIQGSGDHNGDGKADFLWRNIVTGEVAIWLMDGANIIGGGGVGFVPTDWRIVGSGDYNGDGKADILWRQNTGAITMWLMNGATTVAGIGMGVIDRTWRIIGAGDYNGDGKSDILWRHSTNDGALALWLMNGGTILSGVPAGGADFTWTIAGNGDHNGDGNSDLLWRQNTGTIAIWYMNGGGAFGGGGVGTLDTSWRIIQTR